MLVENAEVKYLSAGLPELSTIAVFGGIGIGYTAGKLSPAPMSVPANFSERFGFDIEDIVTIRQVHGNEVIKISRKEPSLYASVEADAIITDLPGVAIGVLTADCLPMLLYDPVKKAIAVVHAGWRGTVAGVAERAIEELTKEYATDPDNLQAVIGPHIGPCCYTVGTEVVNEFSAAYGNSTGALSGVGSIKFDLAIANYIQLLKAGVKEKNVSRENPCTMCRADLFHSFRRDGEQAGRQLSFIMIKE